MNGKNNNNFLLFIRNKFIIEQIMDNLTMNKLLEIIRYNKNLQNNLNKGPNYYKEYSQIEIEIIFKEKCYGNIINYSNENKPFFHIYFDEDKTEINRNDIIQNDIFKKIKIIIDGDITTFNGLFRGCEYIQNMKFIKFNRKNIIDTSYMFTGCASLKELNISNFYTNQVTNMKSMFSGCSSLVKLVLNNFDTNKVTNMNHMFDGCSALKKLDINNFDTNNVKDMSWMFNGCSSLRRLIINKFKTNNVNDMCWMF